MITVSHVEEFIGGCSGGNGIKFSTSALRVVAIYRIGAMDVRVCPENPEEFCHYVRCAMPTSSGSDLLVKTV